MEAPLLALGWKRTMDKYDERYRLKWVECKSKINYNAFKEGESQGAGHRFASISLWCRESEV